MITAAKAIWIDENQRNELTQLERAGKTPQKVALRARIILLASDGIANTEIAAQLHTTRPTVILWRNRFLQLGIPGLLRDRSRPGRIKSITPSVVQEVVNRTLHTTPRDATHWSVRTMATEMGVSRTTVHRIWKQHKLQPHRVETFKLSTDKEFVEKVRDVVGLYMNPPDHALVQCVDEKSQRIGKTVRPGNAGQKGSMDAMIS